MLKFLPNTIQKIHIESKKEVSNSPFAVLGKAKKFFGVSTWTHGQVSPGKFWLRAGPANVFPIVPTVWLNVSDSKKVITGEIKFDQMPKAVLGVWLCLTAISLFVNAGAIIYELVFDDGLVPFTFNDKAGEIRAIPWLFIFLTSHFLAFFVFPAFFISDGWQKTNRLVEEVKAKLETDNH